MLPPPTSSTRDRADATAYLLDWESASLDSGRAPDAVQDLGSRPNSKPSSTSMAAPHASLATAPPLG